ncbi:hypothetical protein [Mycobacterium scrofulaceum]|uniref:Uncharacterized protein n=1 Tax=Mycobacterium scrofulaceum TaxID=1783 RepID=A0A1A2UPJ5_MYCSC|nr:hypothetical protein [Mycobacterium scrofulaceum]OBH90913.1 hypothetical protein A5679_24250 [Mycobacterium scrofulaceum]
MCPSTDAADGHVRFAAAVLRKLLRHIDDENRRRAQPYLISHAWTDGPMMYLVYTAPPSDGTWGLVRDTRESIIDPGPWPTVDEAVLYYYLLDFEENQPSSSTRRPGEPNAIWWFGSPRADLPERPSNIPEAYRRMPSRRASASMPRPNEGRPATPPRRYGNPV